MVSLPSISRIDCVAGVEGDFWRFTKASATYVFSKYFHQDNLEVRAWGNVLSGLGFWVGMAQEDVSKKKKLAYHDPNFPVVITVRAVK